MNNYYYCLSFAEFYLIFHPHAYMGCYLGVRDTMNNYNNNIIIMSCMYLNSNVHLIVIVEIIL